MYHGKDITLSWEEDGEKVTNDNIWAIRRLYCWRS